MTLEEFSTLNIFRGNSIRRMKTLFFADFEDFMLVRWDKHHCEGIYSSPLRLHWDKVQRFNCFINLSLQIMKDGLLVVAFKVCYSRYKECSRVP